MMTPQSGFLIIFRGLAEAPSKAWNAHLDLKPKVGHHFSIQDIPGEHPSSDIQTASNVLPQRLRLRDDAWPWL